MEKVLVTGSSGFIGHHLVKHLKSKGYWVRGVDWKKSEYSDLADEFWLLDLREKAHAELAVKNMDIVYNLAADMGGMGFIQDKNNQGLILYNNTMINFNMFEAMRKAGIKKGFYASSACAYPDYKQEVEEIVGLKESDVYPADPQDTYGWEKLQAEHLALAYNSCYGMDIKVARFHNIYGPEGDYDTGREKAPAAMCRKVIQAELNNEDFMEMWGNGNQVRSFCYISDCLKAVDLLMNSDVGFVVNIGRDDGITINDLARLAMSFNGKELEIRHIEGPVGVKGRNSDNSLFFETFGWMPDTPMSVGLKSTYDWIKQEMLLKGDKK